MEDTITINSSSESLLFAHSRDPVMVAAPEPDHSFMRIAGQALLALLALQTLVQLAKRYIVKPKYPRIPGPWQIPYIGRVHDLPLQYTWLKFKEWADEFGPIYMTKMFGHNLLVLTDEGIVEDLLVKRAKIYSDRPTMRSLVDSKSTHGSMEYLPLMGKNGEFQVIIDCTISFINIWRRILGKTTQMGPPRHFTNSKTQLPRCDGLRSSTNDVPTHEAARRCPNAARRHGQPNHVHACLGRTECQQEKHH